MGANLSHCVEPGPSFSLFQAVKQKDIQAIHFRLGLEPTLLVYRTIVDKETPWHQAASHGSEAVLDALASHVDELPGVSLERAINKRNDKGQTPLMHAAAAGHVGAVKWLLQRGADVWRQDRCGKRSALHYAAMRGRTDCITVLLDHLGSTQELHRYIELRSISGLTPLHFAVALRQAEAARVLLERGADLQAVNTAGHAYDLISVPLRSTPLHVVAGQNDLQSALALLQHYHHYLAGPNYPDPRRRLDALGRAPHRVALARGNGGLLAELLHPSSNLEALFARSGAADRPVIPRLAVIAAAAVRRQLVEDIGHAEGVIMDFRRRHPCGSPTCMIACQTPFLDPNSADHISYPNYIPSLQQQQQQQQQANEHNQLRPLLQPLRQQTDLAATTGCQPNPHPAPCSIQQAQQQPQQQQQPQPQTQAQQSVSRTPVASESALSAPPCSPGGGIGNSSPGCQVLNPGPLQPSAGIVPGPSGALTAAASRRPSGCSDGVPSGGNSGTCRDLGRGSRRGSQDAGRSAGAGGGARRFSGREQPVPVVPGLTVAPMLRPLRMALPGRPPSFSAQELAPREEGPAAPATATATASGACCPVRSLSPFVRRSAGYVESVYSRAPLLPVAQCTVCLDDAYCLVSEPCHHRLCANCARDVTMRAAAMPPACPVCRLGVFQFTSPVCP